MGETATHKAPTLFRYPGGKFYALRLLRRFWEGVKHDEYREPFVGGGSVFFDKPKAEQNWLNDIDNELITTYKCVQHSTCRKELISKFSNEIASKERWREVFEIEPTSEEEIAWRYFYLNRPSFSGKLISPAWGYKPKRSLPPERWHERINPCGQKLTNVELTSVDFANVIEAESELDVLMFIDPPYYKPKKHKHYRHGFTNEDHERLAELLKRTKHKFFLTYEDCPEVRKLYEWANIHEAQFFYRVDNSNTENGKRKIGLELIICNYDLPQSQLNFE
jgi:DNA adenine methylase